MDASNQVMVSQDLDIQAINTALNRVQALIEFDLDGTILHANDNFLRTLGYTLDEVQGKHHAIFCDPDYVKTPEYKAFWTRLGSGEFNRGEFKRFAKDGREVWINASYNPIIDANGKAYKVIKFATDVTEAKRKSADFTSKVDAIMRALAVIEFDMSGKILSANENFLALLDYELDDILDEHHRMFCEADYAGSPEYKKFWQKLGRGEFEGGRYKRIGNHGKTVWIQATYDPIFDLNGKPYKVCRLNRRWDYRWLVSIPFCHGCRYVYNDRLRIRRAPVFARTFYIPGCRHSRPRRTCDDVHPGYRPIHSPTGQGSSRWR